MAKRSSSQCKGKISLKKEMRDQEVEELKKTVKFLETYIVKYSEDCQIMGEKLQKSDDICKDLENKLKNQIELTNTLYQEIEKYKNEISLNRANSMKDIEKFKGKEFEQEAVKIKLLQELEKKNDLLRMASEEVNESSRYRLSIKQKVATIFKTSKIPKKLLQEILDPDAHLSKSLKYFSQIPKIYGENSRLQEENSHLFEKIEHQSPNNDFNELLKDSNGLKYFRNKGNCGKPSCSSNFYYVSSWIPKPIHLALEEFKAKHNPLVASAVISLFYKLNQLWQHRESNRLERLKQKYNNEIAEIQKKKSPDNTMILKKPRRAHTRNSSGGRLRENITSEYKVVSEQMIKLVTEFLEVTERNFNVDKSVNWLIESLLTILAEFTDKILTLI